MSHGEQRPAGGHARHRRRRTDPPVPPDGTPLIRQEPPRPVAEHVSPTGGDATPPPPWAQDRADPYGRLGPDGSGATGRAGATGAYGATGGSATTGGDAWW